MEDNKESSIEVKFPSRVTLDPIANTTFTLTESSREPSQSTQFEEVKTTVSFKYDESTQPKHFDFKTSTIQSSTTEQTNILPNQDTSAAYFDNFVTTNLKLRPMPVPAEMIRTTEQTPESLKIIGLDLFVPMDRVSTFSPNPIPATKEAEELKWYETTLFGAVINETTSQPTTTSFSTGLLFGIKTKQK